MEKYARVLVIIFFLCLFNIGLTVFTLSKINKPTVERVIPTLITQKTATPSATVTTPSSIQSDLTVIKAEIRALRDSLETTGIVTQTPTP